MPQAGMHALVGVLARRSTNKKSWLFLGVLLGSMLPDLDNYAVAVATVTGQDAHGLHRTFTHSVFTILVVLAVFYAIGAVRKDVRWSNLGLGLGIGIGLHMALDLVLWFNGVSLFWPLGSELNFWANTTPPDIFVKILEPAEMLFFGLYFLWLNRTAQSQNTDIPRQKTSRIWMIATLGLFVVFTVLGYMDINVTTVFGALYLVALTAAFVMTIQMRQTVEAH